MCHRVEMLFLLDSPRRAMRRRWSRVNLVMFYDNEITLEICRDSKIFSIPDGQEGKYFLTLIPNIF